MENLTFHGAYYGFSRRERRERAEELLDAFGLLERKDEIIDMFSGGMVQRLLIARALMHRPRVLFLDEPTTGLDPQSRLFLWEQIEALRAAGTTILLTTHDMAEADRLCDRIAIVDHGERIALDTPAGLRNLLPGVARRGADAGHRDRPGARVLRAGRGRRPPPRTATGRCACSPTTPRRPR